MDDDWDSNTPGAVSTNVDSVNTEGRSYGKGRGFKPHNNNDYEEGGVGYKNGFGDSSGGGGFRNQDNDSRWGRSDDNYRSEGGRGSRGGGRGRGGARGGDRGGFRSQNEDNGDSYARSGGFNDDGDEGFRSGGGGRGRGGGRGGGRGERDGDDDRGGRGNRNDGGDKPEPINKEIYIPPEPSNNDEDIFGGGVEMGINFDKYDKIEVRVSGENKPEPIETFEQAGLREFVLTNVKKSGYTKPTPVQKYALPIVMSGRDLMACAQTGSGKTAAFLVPIVNTLLEDPSDLVVSSSHCEPQVVIVSPTRELTIQIYEQARKFSKDSILKCVVAYGGTSCLHQGKQVSAGCHILVATPGRLLDFVDRGRITFASVRFLVLDEADRMLDMGFLPEIERMVDHQTMVPSDQRQTLMFSATFPEDIQHLASRFLNNYLFLAVGIIGGACTDVEQNFYEVSKFEKRNKLKELMERESDLKTARILVFVETKRTADFIAAFLSENNFPTTSIHGDRLQREREEALRDFKRGRMSILVATAVAARGLDIKNVGHVINYDMPKSIDEYVHRIGRTGRVGNRGKATSFFDHDNDGPVKDDLVKILQQAGQPVPDWMESGGGRSFAPGRQSKFGGRDVRDFDNDGGSHGEPYPDSAYTPSAAEEPQEEW